ALGAEDLDGVDHGFRDTDHALPVVAGRGGDPRNVGPVAVVVHRVRVVVYEVASVDDVAHEVRMLVVHAGVDHGDRGVGGRVRPDHRGVDPVPTALQIRVGVVVVAQVLALEGIGQERLDRVDRFLGVRRRPTVLSPDPSAGSGLLGLRLIEFRDVRY